MFLVEGLRETGASQMDENATRHHTGTDPAGAGTRTHDQSRGQQQSGTADQAMQQAKTMARDLGEQARTVASDPAASAQDLARRAREQAGVAGDALYRQGQRAGEYLTQNVNEYPLTALLIAGMIGYGLAFLVHTSWQDQALWGDDAGARRRVRQ